MKVSQDYYPECIGKCFIVNAPFIFTAIWGIVKAWIDEKTKKKIFVLGSNFLKTILEYIDIDQIPTFMGGKNEASYLDEPGPWSFYDFVEND